MSALEHKDTDMNTRSGYHLDKTNGKFMGVCAGMASSFGWDVNVVRIGFALGTIFGFGSLILVYLAIGLIAD